MNPKLEPAKTFRDLVVWHKAHEFVLAVYRFTTAFPKQETYGLASQMRRAAVSIPANIAEGFDSGSSTDFAHFLTYSRRSGSEVQSHLYVALDRQYITQGEFEEAYVKAIALKSLVGGLIRHLRGGSRRTLIGT